VSFVVVRHPEAGVGTAPVSGLYLLEANGWQVVSDERAEPSMFHLPDFAAAAETQPEPPAQLATEHEDEEQG
jgi:hypothetical protein